MNKSLDSVILRILNELGVGVLDDKDRFVSAMIDLGEFSDNERNLLIRTIDETYLDICRRTLTCNPQAVQAVAHNASGYLQHEYKLAGGWADDISAKVVSAIWSFSHPDEEPFVWEPAGSHDPEQETEQRRPFERGTDHRRTFERGHVHRQTFERRPAGKPVVNGEAADWDSTVYDRSFSSGYGAGGAEYSNGRYPGAGYIGPEQGKNEQRRKRSIVPALIIGAVVFFAGLGCAFWMMAGSGEDADGNDTEQGQAASEGNGSENKEGIVELGEWHAKVLDSDWDWDSSPGRSSDGYYTVDTILYVENDSPDAITKIKYEVESKGGNKIDNAKDGGTEFTADGYVEAGAKGIMVGRAYTNEDGKYPRNSTYRINAAYTNYAIMDYAVPSGRITYNYGPDNDYYDVYIDNPNDVEVNASAKLVAVCVENDQLSEADATGRIDSPIGANSVYEQKKAFDDPNFNMENDALTIYAIDSEFYRDCR